MSVGFYVEPSIFSGLLLIHEFPFRRVSNHHRITLNITGGSGDKRAICILMRTSTVPTLGVANQGLHRNCAVVLEKNTLRT